MNIGDISAVNNIDKPCWADNPTNFNWDDPTDDPSFITDARAKTNNRITSYQYTTLHSHYVKNAQQPKLFVNHGKSPKSFGGL